jgi:hypothetical protein
MRLSYVVVVETCRKVDKLSVTRKMDLNLYPMNLQVGTSKLNKKLRKTQQHVYLGVLVKERRASEFVRVRLDGLLEEGILISLLHLPPERQRVSAVTLT